MKTRERKYLVALTFIAVSVIFLLVSVHVVMAEIKWNMTTIYAPNLRQIDADKHFVNLVNETCKGELLINFIPAGSFVPATEVFDAVRAGTVHASTSWGGYWAGKDSAFSILGGLPFGPQVFDINTWIFEGGGQKLAQELSGKYGMMHFFYSYVPIESGIRSGKKRFTTVEDFKGAKIRMGGKIQGAVLKDLGAAQTMLSAAEVYQGLEKGVIDAAEYAGPFVDWVLGMQEVTSIWNVPGWNQVGSMGDILINKKAWDALPEIIKKRIEVAAMATCAWSLSHFYYLNGVYTQKFIDKGTIINHMDEASINKIEQLSFRRMEEEAQKNPLFAKILYSQYQTMQIIAPFRNETELDLLKRPINLPNMEVLKKAANK